VVKKKRSLTFEGKSYIPYVVNIDVFLFVLKQKETKNSRKHNSSPQATRHRMLSSLSRGFGKIIPGSLMIAKAVADQSNKTH